MPDLDQERRAYEMLQWVPYGLQAEFDEELAVKSAYSQAQSQRSNAALAAWDKDHQHQQSPELSAFKALEALGVYTQTDFFSPTKAKDGYYSRRLRNVLSDSGQSERAPAAAAANRRPRRHRPL